VKEIHRMIQRAPQYQKELDHLSMHVHLAGDCTEHYSQGIQDLCAVEQDLAMGTDSNGDAIAEPMQRIMPTLFNRNIRLVFGICVRTLCMHHSGASFIRLPLPLRSNFLLSKNINQTVYTHL